MEELVFKGVIALPLLLLSLCVHESAHALAALKLGDDTAAKQGRISLYPPRHLDPMGSLLLPVLTLYLMHGGFVYGFARPAPVDPGKLQEPKKDYSLVAAAGPLSNWLLALLLTLLGYLSLGPGRPPLVAALLGWGIMINVLLGFVNLLPLPGQDGIKVLYAFLPDAWCWRLNKPQPLFFLVLLLAYSMHFLDWVYMPVLTAIVSLCQWSGSIVPFQA